MKISNQKFAELQKSKPGRLMVSRYIKEVVVLTWRLLDTKEVMVIYDEDDVKIIQERAFLLLFKSTLGNMQGDRMLGEMLILSDEERKLLKLE